MNKIILALYFGSNLAENVASDSKLSSIFTYNNLIIMLIVMLVILIISLLVFLIIPKINKTPKKYYQRYLIVRKELDKIDELYARRKLSFENYAFTQFHYAKEYEHLIEYLSQFPEYKDKLKSYKLNYLRTQEQPEKHLSEEEKKNAEIINYFIRVLGPVAPYYRKNEVYQAILDEKFSKVIAEGIIKGLEKIGVKFNSKEISENRKGIELVDKLLLDKQDKIKQKEQEQPKKYTMPDVIDKSIYLSRKAAQEKEKQEKEKIVKPVEPEKPKEVSKTEKIEPQIEIRDDFFESTTDSIKVSEPTTISLKDLIKKESQKPMFEKITTVSKYPEESSKPATKKGLFKSIKNIFKPKRKYHSVSEINDIFENIEKKLR